MTSVTSRPPFPFIVGCGRSGTTMLRLMLDSHPEMAIPEESYFPMWPRREIRVPGGGVDVDRFLASIARTDWFARWAVDPRRARASLPSSGPVRYADAIRGVFAAYAAEQDKPRFGNKTPIHVLSIDRLSALFPEAVFIHIIRDGRDVAGSLLEVPFGPATMAEAAAFWRDRVERGRASGRRLGRRRYREVRYEALIEDPERELRELAAFSGLDFDPIMLRSHERAAAAKPNAAYHARLGEPPSRGRDWRRQFDAADREAFEAIAGPTLRRLGYERGSRLTPAVAARSRVADAKRRIALSRGVARSRRVVARSAPTVGAPTR